MKLRFLLDEHISLAIKPALLHYDPAIDVLRIGDIGAPPFNTPDPIILLFAQQTQRALITSDFSSMPGHSEDHINAGGHHWGVFRIRRSATLGGVIQELCLLWVASEAEEWIDQMDWIPL